MKGQNMNNEIIEIKKTNSKKQKNNEEEQYRLIINKEMNAGYHTVDFSANGLSSGVYFYTINAGSFTKTMKMVLAK